MSRHRTADPSRDVLLRQAFIYPAVRSDRAREVARYFEIEDRAKGPAPATVNTPRERLLELLPPAGGVTLITGASGSGKSSLLRMIRETLSEIRFIDLHAITPKEVPIVDLFPQFSLRQTLVLLSQVGLTEAWTYLRLPSELSDGQRWRLKLAIAVELADGNDTVLLCDEFAALLDRLTARIVAHRLSKLISGRQIRAILATGHDDLDLPLNPAIKVRCDFNVVVGEKWRNQPQMNADKKKALVLPQIGN